MKTIEQRRLALISRIRHLLRQLDNLEPLQYSYVWRAASGSQVHIGRFDNKLRW